MNDNVSMTVRRALAALDYDPDRDGIVEIDGDDSPILDVDHDVGSAKPEAS